jgi:DNA-binding PadR family transcriptional regulator
MRPFDSSRFDDRPHGGHPHRGERAGRRPERGGRDEHAGRGGRGGPGRERRLGHGDLRLLLLALIEPAPCHGYELIRKIGEAFDGLYQPSPGAVYPVLAHLEAHGLIEADASEEGGRKCYRLTADGQAFVQAHREDMVAAQQRTATSARMLRAKASLPAPVRKAMHRLKTALLARQERWDEAEATRVAAVLEAAAQALERGGDGD